MLNLNIKKILLLSLLSSPILGADIDHKINALFNALPKKCTYFITSGFRTKAKNRAVGGAKNSYHLHDRARDIGTNCRLNVIRSSKLYGLTVIIYNTHLHLDDRETPQCLVKTKGGYRYCKTKDYQVRKIKK